MSGIIPLVLNAFWLLFLEDVISLWVFLSFYARDIVGFLLFCKNDFYMLSRFSLTAIYSHRTLHLAFVMISIRSAATDSI